MTRSRELSGGRLLLLSGDKGDHRLEDYQRRDLPSLTLHDTGFSITFNYNALSRYFEDLGGEVVSTSFRATSLNILAFVLGAPSTVETRQRSRLHRAEQPGRQLHGPDFGRTEPGHLARGADGTGADENGPRSHHVFLLVWPQLSKKLQGMPEAAIPEVRQMVERVWANYFELREKHNLPFHLGVLLAAMGTTRSRSGFSNSALAETRGIRRRCSTWRTA